MGVAGALFVLAGLFYFLWSSSQNSLAEARAELAIALEVNTANQDAIAKLQQEADTLDRLLIAARENEAEIRRQANADRQEFQELMDNDADAQNWGDTPMPDSVIRLLNAPPVSADGSSEGDGAANSDDAL